MTQTAHREHPSQAFYWGIAAFLAVVTAIEIAIPSISALDSVKVPLLWLLAALKFGTVAAFFMHLRYDRKIYKTLFLFGVIGIIPLMVVLLLTMGAF